MPGIKLYCEPTPDYYYFKKEIISKVRNGQHDWLAVLPVNRAARALTRELIDYSPNKILSGSSIFTFNQLLLNIYAHMDFSKTVISNDLMIFLLEETLKKLAPQFSFLPCSVTPSPRLIQKITGIVDELRRFGYTAQEFSSKDATFLGIEKTKFDDFILIFRELESLFANRYIDSPQAIHQASLNINESLMRKIHPGLSEIFISGYGLFTPAMYNFIEKTSAVFTVHLKLEYNTHNAPLFEHTQSAFTRFQRMGAEIIYSAQPNLLAGKLFNRDRKAGIYNAEGRFSLLKCDNHNNEITRIARNIYFLAREKKVPLERIAVTCSSLEQYVPAIRRTFSDFGIPFNLSTGFSLKQSPLVTSLVNTAGIVNENYEYSFVFDLYLSPFFNSGSQAYFSKLYKTIVENRIRYLNKGWPERLKDSLQKRAVKISPAMQSAVDSLNTFLQPFYAFGSHRRTAGQFKNDFFALLQNCKVTQWYKSAANPLDTRQKEREFRAYNRFIKIVDQFSWSLQIIFRDQEIELKTWLQHLRSAINNSVYNLTEWPQKAVQIMPRLEIQAVDYDYLFIAGLVDGDFPRSSSADIFFSDANREKMGLVANEDLLAQDRFMFFNLLESAGKHVFLTVPRYLGEKALVPSTFISDLQECCSINTENNVPELMGLPGLWESLGLAVQEQNRESAQDYIKTIRAFDNPQNVNNLFYKILAQHQRMTLDNPVGIYEGSLQDRPAIKQYLNDKFSEHSWSITQLEDYAFCPMQYFLKRVLRLEELPEFEEEISPLERGNTMHNILFRFYSQLRDKNAARVPHHYLELLHSIAREELNKLPFEGFFWELEQIRFFGKGELPGLLGFFLEKEKEAIEESGFIPAHFEFCFGPAWNKEVDPASVEEMLTLENPDGTHIKINGKIDRIDINPQNGQALVFDYKTGSIAGKNATPIAKGLSFQLPVYILAVEQLLQPALQVVYGGYYQVKDIRNCAREAAIADPQKYPYLDRNSKARLPNRYSEVDGQKLTFDELIEFSKQQALQTQNGLLNAEFKHTKYPDDKMCSTFCDYRRMCQKHVAKIKRQNRLKSES